MHRALLSTYDDKFLSVEFVCDVKPGEGSCREDCANDSHFGIHEDIGVGNLDDEQIEEYGDCVIVPVDWCNLVLWLGEDPTGYCANEEYLYEAYRAGAREVTIAEIWWEEDRHLWTAKPIERKNT